MNYAIYKLDFHTGVHFGNGMLNDSVYTFQADQLFSALFIEALKLRRDQELYSMVQEGRLCFSDAFPYVNDEYMIPKPMLYVEHDQKGSSEQKKAYKKMKYIPIKNLEEFLKGNMSVEQDVMKDYGQFKQQTMAAVRGEEETVPFRVGTFYYEKNCGLYVICAYEGIAEKELFETLFEALSYTGIGGKKNTGMGKFTLRYVKCPEIFMQHFNQKSGMKMLLSVALPEESELESVLEGASYQLLKRSGFVASTIYAEETRKKKDLYVFGAGSCFMRDFLGDIYDVSDGGNHPVYRYAKPLFMGVSK